MHLNHIISAIYKFVDVRKNILTYLTSDSILLFQTIAKGGLLMDQIDKYLQFKKEVAQATIKIIEQFQKSGIEGTSKRTSNIDIVQYVLKSAGRPVHVSEIIRLVKQDHGIELNRDSIVSAMLKKVNSGQEFIRTAPNTFALAKEERT